MPISSAPTTSVDAATMRAVYDEVKTPFKYGIVLRGEGGKIIDCPNVFRHQNHWYMLYVCMNEVGYETHLAQSDNLLDWEKIGKVLSFRPDGWDQWQADGGMALIDPTWGGSAEPESFDGKYWISYIGGALNGYEPDPLSIGLAWAKSPNQTTEWTRLESNPVLSTFQDDVRDFERKTLYKSSIIHDRSLTLGHPLVMFYNGKQEGKAIERIGMAVSDDMIHWKRFGDGPVVDNHAGISGDPQIVKIGDLWVMFYFGHAYRPPGAFDTFAVSHDLVNWTKWDGPDLTAPSEPWDAKFAHKPWVLKHDGVVYHFYCAVGNENRVIGLATSKDLNRR